MFSLQRGLDWQGSCLGTLKTLFLGPSLTMFSLSSSFWDTWNIAIKPDLLCWPTNADIEQLRISVDWFFFSYGFYFLLCTQLQTQGRLGRVPRCPRLNPPDLGYAIVQSILVLRSCCNSFTNWMASNNRNLSSLLWRPKSEVKMPAGPGPCSFWKL